MPHVFNICACVGLLLALQLPYEADATGSAVTIHINGPVRIIYGSPEDGGSTQGSSAEQCSGDDGFCVESGDRCNGTVKLLHNSCNDHCSCCVPEKKAVCESPWVTIGSSGCFLFAKGWDFDEENWDGARRKCQDLGADLAVLDSNSKHQELVDYMDDLNNANLWNLNYWVGGRRPWGGRRNWQWINGVPFTEGFYKGDSYIPAQPDGDYNADPDWCLTYRMRIGAGIYTLEDDPCTEEKEYVCEK